MMTPYFRPLILILFSAASAKSGAMSCSGPDLSSIAVSHDGSLTIQGTLEEARSADGGKTWLAYPKKGNSMNLSWEEKYKDKDGNVYRNSNIEQRAEIQVSPTGKMPWRPANYANKNEESLVVGARGEKVYFFAGNNFRLNDYGPIGSIKAGELYAIGRDGRRISMHFTAGKAEVARMPGLNKNLLNTYLEGPESAVTGFNIGPSGEMYISTTSNIFVSTNDGETWDSISYPRGWMVCNGEPPRPQPIE